MARETTKWPSTRWPITKIMSSDGCNGNRVPLEMGPWYDFREFGCHLGNVGSDQLRPDQFEDEPADATAARGVIVDQPARLWERSPFKRAS